MSDSTRMPAMRVLTVREPWASAIIHLGKDVENRRTPLAGGWTGPVAILAAQTVDREAWGDLEAGWPLVEGGPTFTNSQITEMVFGAIIGVVDLTSVHRCYYASGCEGTENCSKWAERPEKFGNAPLRHLRLARPRALRAPIKHRGALGLKWAPLDLQRAIEKELP